jgi:acetyl-CoA carboxylase biotin carboxylase subunit
VIDGLETIIPLHQRLMNEADFVDGNYDIHWLERFVESGQGGDKGEDG